MKLLSKIIAIISIQVIATNASYGQIDTVLSLKYYKAGLVKYDENRDYAGAIIDFDSSIYYNSKAVKSYYGRALAESQVGKYKEAISDFSKVLLINNKNIASYLGRAQAKNELKEYQEAIEDFNIVLKYSPNNQSAIFGRAFSYMALDKCEEAIADYSRVLELRPDLWSALFQRGLSYYMIKRYSEAISDFNNLFRLKESNKSEYMGAYCYRAMAYSELGKSDSAIIDFEYYFKKNAKTSEGMWRLAKAYFDNDNIDMARKYYKESLALDSNNLKAYYYWGLCEVLSGDSVLGKNLLTKVKNLTDSPSKDLYYFMAVAEAKTGEMAMARKDIDVALQMDDKYLMAYYLRIHILMESKESDALVINDVNKIINLDSEPSSQAASYFFKGWISFRQGKNIIAKQDIDKAISIYPNEAAYYVLRAYLMFYIMNKPLNESVEEKIQLDQTVLDEIDNAIKIDNKYWQAYALKASLYNLMDERGKACTNISMAVKLGGSVSKIQKDYICKGEKPKNGEVPDLEIFTRPKLGEGAGMRW